MFKFLRLQNFEGGGTCFKLLFANDLHVCSHHSFDHKSIEKKLPIFEEERDAKPRSGFQNMIARQTLVREV